MSVTLPLDKMTVEEKMQVMEAVWTDLRAKAASYPSPKWHEQLVRERVESYTAGTSQLIDWEDAKKALAAVL